MCMRTYAYLMFMYARAFVCACVRSRVRARARACVRACVCIRVCSSLYDRPQRVSLYEMNLNPETCLFFFIHTFIYLSLPSVLHPHLWRSQRPLAVFNTLHLLIADFLIFNFRRYFNNAPIISRAGYLALFSQFYICLLFRLIFNVVFHGDLLLWRTLLY